MTDKDNLIEKFENIGIYPNGQFFLGSRELRIGSEVELCTDIKFQGNELMLSWDRAFVCGLEDHRNDKNKPGKHTGTKAHAFLILALGDGSSSDKKVQIFITDPNSRPRIRWPDSLILTRGFNQNNQKEERLPDSNEKSERKHFGKGRIG